MYCRIINSHKFANIKKPLVKFRFHNQSISSHKEKLQKKILISFKSYIIKIILRTYSPQIALNYLLIILCPIIRKLMKM